jgi:outer membrane lipoprotein-sorting protein
MCKKSIVDGRWSIVNSANSPQSTVHSNLLLKQKDAFKKIYHRLWTMDYGLFLLLALVLFNFSASAQYAGFKPIDDLPTFKKQFSVEAKKISTIKSNFVQEKNLALLEEKMSSEGKFTFKRENRVRIEYTKPFQYLMIMNGDQMLVRDNQKESKVNVKSNKLFQQVNKIMVDCVQGTILDNKDFSVRVFQNEKNFLLEMTTVSKTLKEFFQTIIIYAEKKDYSVSSIDMREPSGDNTVIKFIQKELNTVVADDVFAVK